MSEYNSQDLGDFELEDGGTIRGLTFAYATFESLSPDKDNAILFPTWYSGTSKILEQAYVGPERALDPGKYFAVRFPNAVVRAAPIAGLAKGTTHK